MIEQRQSQWKRYQNYRNSENYITWRNTAELADTSLVNDKINKVEQIYAEDDAANKRNDTNKLFIIVKKLNGDQKTSPSLAIKRNVEPPTSIFKLLKEWADRLKGLL